MKRLSILFLVIGASLLAWGLTFDVSVQSIGKRVVNIGLLQDRNIIIGLGGGLSLIGVMVILLGKNSLLANSQWLVFIDEMSQRDLLFRIATAAIITTFGWFLLLMHIWSSMLSLSILAALVLTACMLEKPTNKLLQYIWLASLILTITMTTYHSVGNLIFGPLEMTFSVISAAISFIDSDSLIIIFSLMIGTPFFISLMSFLYFRLQRT
jgi:hypothetical protein